MSNAVGNMIFNLLAENAKFISVMKESANTFQRIVGRMEDRAKQFGQRLKVTVAGALAGLTFERAFSSLLEANQEYERLSGALETVTGSAQKASQEFDRLQRFASTTPFNLEQSIEAFIRLKTLGLDPSEEAMRSYGNTASAFGKDMMQFIEAVADAATGEFERLKEFGIRARQNQETVEFTFQGITTTVKKNADAITEYLQKIGKVNFGGAMERQMERLPGKISNLKDNFNKLKIEIGKGGFTGAVEEAVSAMSGFIQDFIDSGKAAEIGRILGESFRTVTDALIWMVDWIGKATTTLDNFFANVSNEFWAWYYGVDPNAVHQMRADEIARKQTATIQSGGNIQEFPGGVVFDWSKVENSTEEIASNSKETVRSWETLEEIVERMSQALKQRQDYLRGQVEALWNSMLTQREIHHMRLEELHEAFELGIIKTEEELQILRQRVEDEFNGMVEASRRSAMQMEANFSSIFLDAMHGKFDNFFQRIIHGFDQIFADLLARNFFNMIEPFFMGGGLGSFGRFLFGGVRAGGGAVYAGQSYLVGERGPEWFVPEVSGRIEPAGKGISIGDIHIHVQGDGVSNARKTGAQISNELLAQLQMAQLRGDV